MEPTPPPTLWRIRRVLDNSRNTSEREEMIASLLPLLWNRLPWVRYRAACMLTTRIYLPFGMHPLEVLSFPAALIRRLRKAGHRTPPATPELRREALRDTLCGWLKEWSRAYLGQQQGAGRPSMDVGSDLCEAIGRLGYYEAEAILLDLLMFFRREGGYEVRYAVLIALAELPPTRLVLLWERLSPKNEKHHAAREILAASLAYMGNTEAVPFLLELVAQTPAYDLDAGYFSIVLRPTLKALGRIGDTRALPALNAIVRDESHPERATARLAIQRLMKQAEGHEEVSLLRASDLSTLNQDVLLRASDGMDDRLHPKELLRPSASESQKEDE